MEDEQIPITLDIPGSLARRLQQLSQVRGVDVPTLIRVSMMNIARRSRYYELNTAIAFGKYNGEMMETVIRCDPGYVSWCLRSMEQFELSEPCLTLLQEMEHIDRSPA